MKIKKILMAAAMVIGFASCSSEGELTPAVDTLKDTPIQIKASVAGMKTRAGYEVNTALDKFYLKVEQSYQDYNYDVIMKLENGKWVAYDANDETQTVQMLWAGYFINYHFWPSTFKYDKDKCNVKLSVLKDQSSEENLLASDHLWGEKTAINETYEEVSLTLEHQMSKLSIELTLGDQYDNGDNPVSEVRVIGTKRELLWDNYHPEIGDETAAEDIIPCFVSYTKPTTDVKNAKVKYEVILVPQTVDAGNFGIEFKVSDKTYRWYSDAAVKLDKGTLYTLQLRAGKDQANPIEVKSTAWNESTGGNIETH